MLDRRQEIEVELSELKESVELGKVLEKLERSSAFKKLIVKEYFEVQPAAMAPISVSPDEKQRNAAIIALQGVGSLQSFLNAVRRKAMMAESALAEYEAELAGSGEV